MEPDLNEQPNLLAARIQVAFFHKDMRAVEEMLRRLPLAELLETLQQVRDGSLQTIMFGQIERELQRQPLGNAERPQVLQWLVQQAEEIHLLQGNATRQAFLHLFGSGVMHLCWRGEEITRVVETLGRHFEDNQMRSVDTMCLFKAIVVAAEENPTSKTLRTLENSLLNSFVYAAFSQLTSCITRAEEGGQEMWHWNGDLLTTTASLELLLACTNYDFFGTKRSVQMDEFTQDRSPLLIPCRPSKHENFKCYECLKDVATVGQLLYLHDIAESPGIRCMCIELICDMSRLQMRFFKSQQSFVEFSNELVSTLDEIAKFLRLGTTDDYQHVLCYLTNINKCLTMFAFNRLEGNCLRDWVLNTMEFARAQLFKESLLPPPLLKPLFTFLVGISRALLETHPLHEFIKTSVDEFIKEYTSCLFRVSDGRAANRQPSTDIMPILLTIEPDPLQHLPCIDDYLVPYKLFEVMLPLEPLNYEELLWCLYMRCKIPPILVEYLSETLEQVAQRNGEESAERLQRLRRQVADCVLAVAQLQEFKDLPHYKDVHTRNLYAFMIGKLQHNIQIIPLVRECELPIAEAARWIYELGSEWQTLIEHCLFLVYVCAVNCDRLYELFVERVQYLRKHQPVTKELSRLYRYCFILSSGDISYDVLSFIGSGFRMGTATDFLELTRRYDMQNKYRPLLRFIVEQDFIGKAVEAINAYHGSDVQGITKKANKVTFALYSLFKIDAVNRIAHTNKAQLCRLFVPAAASVVGFLGQLLSEHTKSGAEPMIVKLYCKLSYVLKRLLQLSYLEIQQLGSEPVIGQIKMAVCEFMYVTTEMNLEKWPDDLLQLCNLLYRNERSLFRDDVYRKYYLILLRFLPVTQHQLPELIALADCPTEYVHLLLQAIDKDQDSVAANEKFIEEYLNNSIFEAGRCVTDGTYSESLSQILARVADRKAMQEQFAKAKIPEYGNFSEDEEAKEPDSVVVLEALNPEKQQARASSRNRNSILNHSSRNSEQAKDTMPDIFISSDPNQYKY